MDRRCVCTALTRTDTCRYAESAITHGIAITVSEVSPIRPVSARFLAAVSGSYRMVSRVRVVAAGQNGTNPTALAGGTLDNIGGAVTLDSTADVRGTVDLTTSATFWPTSATAPLAPYGNELFVERGVVYGDGGKEWVSQGYYRIESVEQQDAPNGTVDITGSDRMAGIRDARIPYPLTFAAGSLVTDVITSLVVDVYSWATFAFDASLVGVTLASAQITTDDRLGILKSIVTSYGMVGYWDYRGVFVVAPPPDGTVPVATVKSGAGGVLTGLSRTLNRDSVYNACVASGEQLDDTIPPVSALVVDNDPDSPTYWFGPFGHVPQFYSSSFLATPAQCLSAAQSILSKSTGLPYTVDFAQVPNPALEPLDPIRLSYPRGNEQHVISQVVIPLDATTAQTAQTRQLVSGVFK